MKTKLLNIVFIAFAAIFLAGCRKKENLNVNIFGLGGDDWIKTELDQWLYTNYTKPYNIEVKYRWDRSELGEQIYKNVAPIKEELVKPVMEAVKIAWLEPYIAVKDENFFKTYSQKQFYLTGSPYYDGLSMGLGIAEGGRSVLLLNLNTFDKTKKEPVKQILHTIHHEFGHILNQNKAVDPEYAKITPDKYTATWFNVRRSAYTSQAAYEADLFGLGFITPYSRANKDEDFVEMLATLLEGGQAYFDNIINNLFIYDENFSYIIRNTKGIYEKNREAIDKLLKKKAMLVSYLADNWGINLSDLQTKTQEAIEKLIPTPDFHTLVGFDKIYNKITINPQRLTGLSAKFLTAFNTANNAMLAAPTSSTSTLRYIDNISLIFNTAETMTLRIVYLNPLEPFNKSLNAEFKYNISNTNGLLTMTYAEPQPTNANARAIEQYVNALLVYFNDQQFNIRWVDDIIPQSKNIFGGFVKIEDPSSYLFGTL